MTDRGFDREASGQDYYAATTNMLTADRLSKPFCIHRPKLYKDGDMWCALYGANIMEGVVAFGETPQEAEDEFNKAWVSK